jgi:RimJ/RimL family protein N-acetyltransferase
VRNSGARVNYAGDITLTELDNTAKTRLIETTDADFAWMIRGSDDRGRELSLPAGGVESETILVYLRDLTPTLTYEGHTHTWMIVSGNEVVGLCGHKHRPTDDGTVDIGYGVTASKRRQGYAAAAVALMLAKAKKDPRITALIAETVTENIPSQGVLRKNGFVRIGRAIDSDGDEIIRWRADAR